MFAELLADSFNFARRLNDEKCEIDNRIQQRKCSKIKQVHSKLVILTLFLRREIESIIICRDEI